MQDKGDQLAEALWQVGTGWKSWGECPICDAEYPANIASHVRGKNHCNKLKDKLGWREPQSFEEFEKYWQCWPLQSGRIFMFHHLTGTQKTEEGTAGTGVPGATPPMQPARQPAPQAVPQPMPQPMAPQMAPQMAAPMAPQMAAPTPAASGGLLVDHNNGCNSALQLIESWRRHVDKSAKLLEEELSQRTNRWDHQCQVCDKAMTRGAEDHFKSKGHWTLLWKMTKGRAPADAAQMGPQVPWVQSWQVPGGCVMFNHLTAAVMLELGGAPSAPATTPAPVMPQPVVQPSQPVVPAQPMPQSQPLMLDHKPDWQKAIMDQNLWSQHMEAPGQAVEECIPTHRNCLCKICESDMKDGAKAHLTSESHWAALSANMKSLNANLPPPQIAMRMESVAWVQKFGPYIFNHLTGAFQPQNMPGAGATAGPCPAQVPAAAYVPPVQAQPVAPVQPQPVAQPTPAPAAITPQVTRNGIHYREALMDLGKWKKFMDEPTTKLDDMYPMMSNFTGRCMVCEANLLGYQEHFCSSKHFKNLQKKFDRGLPDEPDATDWQKPWVEKIATSRGVFLHNHLTGQQAFEAEISAAPPGPQAQVQQPNPGAGLRPITVEEPMAPKSPNAVMPAMPAMPRTPDSCVPPEQTQLRRPRTEHLQYVCQLQPLLATLRKAMETMGGGDVWEGTPSPSLGCTVCGSQHDAFADHLASTEHYNQIQAILAECVDRPIHTICGDQRWHQTVGNFAFNHLTLQSKPLM